MILLVTGGSASGKSEYAQNRALQLAKTEQKKADLSGGNEALWRGSSKKN